MRATAACFGAELRVVDCRDEFAEEFVLPAIRAHAVYLDVHPISASLSRPLMARRAMREAAGLGAGVVLHTANRSQNSLRRLNGALAQLGFDGAYGSPYEHSIIAREDKLAQLVPFGIDPQLARRSHSGDSNLWCREFESGTLDDPEEFFVPEALYRWTLADAAAQPRRLEIRFEAGVPVAADGETMPLAALIRALNGTVGRFGLGRYTGLEHLDDGEKVLETREMPAAFALLYAYRQLETACVAAETIRAKMAMEQIWVREAVEGRWFAELRAAAQSFIAEIASCVTGTVTFVVTPHGLDVVSVRAARPRYIRDRDAWEREKAAAAQPLAARAVAAGARE
jgi:argininosuccinate synthase